MYSDGDRKTISELRREAAVTRNKIIEESIQIERIQKALERRQTATDQLFRLFAQGVEENDRVSFLKLLLSDSEDIDLGSFPFLPFILALANGRLTHVKSLRAANNRHVDDGTVIFLAHVLRFAPSITQVNMLDISGTKVSEKGLFFLLEMMEERATGFTLVAKDRIPMESPPDATFKEKFEEVLKRIQKKKCCTITS